MPVTYAVVGIDVGGTRTKGVALSAAGEVLAEESQPTPRTDTATHLGPFVGGLVGSLGQHLDRTVAHVGVAVPGLVDEGRGVGLWSANLGWRDLDLLAALDPYLPAPVSIGHDVRTGLVGEHRLGAARGYDEVCFVPLGTGLAAALLSGGRVVRGSAWTGEIGHLTVDPDGELCGCGRRGCAEALIGGAGLARRWRRATGEGGEAIDIVRRAAAGDPAAVRIWASGIDALATVLAPVVAAAGTELVVIGGGLSGAGDQLLGPLTAGLRSRLGHAPVQVVRAALGDRAGALGAAVLAGETVTDR